MPIDLWTLTLLVCCAACLMLCQYCCICICICICISMRIATAEYASVCSRVTIVMHAHIV
jgi:hypothetical protein